MKVVDAVAKERGVPVAQIIKEWADLMPAPPRQHLACKQLLMDRISKYTGVLGLGAATTLALNGLYFLLCDTAKGTLPTLSKGTKANYVEALQNLTDIPLQGLMCLGKEQLVSIYNFLSE